MTPLSNSTTISSNLIIKLIKEDLKSNKLLFGFHQLGIVAEPYHSDLSSIILVLMGFTENDDQAYAFYQEHMERLTSLETAAFHQKIDSLAQELYYQLRIRAG